MNEISVIFIEPSLLSDFMGKKDKPYKQGFLGIKFK